MPTEVRHLTDSDLSTLSNICQTAAERFSENARLFRELEQQQQPPEGTIAPTGPAAARLAEQFEKQAKEAREFSELFISAYPITIETDEEEAA